MDERKARRALGGLRHDEMPKTYDIHDLPQAKPKGSGYAAPTFENSRSRYQKTLRKIVEMSKETYYSNDDIKKKLIEMREVINEVLATDGKIVLTADEKDKITMCFALGNMKDAAAKFIEQVEERGLDIRDTSEDTFRSMLYALDDRYNFDQKNIEIIISCLYATF